ncbi:hypothetical protein CASFOL_013592 [Castilleja foliolosa]|uniref:Uncharacterized protein n=1 Tax=Castilleja foliolosa TaxID=1961234 RepID=A0ABD3DL35_9LAMI
MGHGNVAKLWLENGADVDPKDGCGGEGFEGALSVDGDRRVARLGYGESLTTITSSVASRRWQFSEKERTENSIRRRWSSRRATDSKLSQFCDLIIWP